MLMTKQEALDMIDEEIINASQRKTCSKKYVSETLQGIRQAVSDIDDLGYIDEETAKGEKRIMNAVCSITGLTREALKRPTRRSDVIRARKIYSVCMNQMLNANPEVIGKFIGKHRTTVFFHLGKHEGDMRSCPEYRNIYNKVCEKLETK